LKVLIIGSGGREHTLAWVCARSGLKPAVFCAPGNGGTAEIAENVYINVGDFKEVLNFVGKNSIDLVIVGPEAPLVDGLADVLTSNGCLVFGPGKQAANIEGSKAFAMQLMLDCGVPTAEFATFTNLDAAKRYILNNENALVVKASGLAAGKGAIICSDSDEAVSTASAMLEGGKFGEAGKTILIEELLTGMETSLMAFVDGEDYLLLPPSRDHKQAFDNDEGPNTGGMGAFSPLDDLTPENTAMIAKTIFPPVLKKLTELGTPYSGLLYPGLMLTDKNTADKGVKVLEFNCRFGDPEAQVVLPIMTQDPLEIMLAVAEGKLGKWMLQNNLDKHNWQKLTGGQHAATVVVAAEGYPESYVKGMKIENLPEETDNVITFHAGTALKNADLITSGGRIVAITGLGNTHNEAVTKAYSAVGEVVIEGTRYRKDIGRKASQ